MRICVLHIDTSWISYLCFCFAAHSKIPTRVALFNCRVMVIFQFSICFSSFTWLSSKLLLVAVSLKSCCWILNIFCLFLYEYLFFSRVQLLRQVLHLLEQLCLVLNDEFRTYLLHVLPCCIQLLSDSERYNDYTYVLDILHTLEVFGGEYFLNLDIYALLINRRNYFISFQILTNFKHIAKVYHFSLQTFKT